jgi:hypothetical protein
MGDEWDELEIFFVEGESASRVRRVTSRWGEPPWSIIDKK